MDFSGITGHKELIGSLMRSIDSNQVGHAYLFTGPEGVGKKTVARLFSGILLCNEPFQGKSCGKCPSCRAFEAGSHPDLVEIAAEETSIYVDDIRGLLADIAVKPYYGGRKVYLIIEADKMTEQAQNCLLKTLEGPPPFAVIILTTAVPEALIETIRSRVVKYTFHRNTPDEVRAFLESRQETSEVGPEDIGFIAAYSGGIIGKALALFHDGEFRKLRENTLKVALDISKAEWKNVFSFLTFFNNNKSRMDDVFEIMLSFYRDFLVVKKTGKENRLINSDKKDMIVNTAKDFSTQKLVENIETVEQVRLSIKRNVNFQLAVEAMILKLREDSYRW